MSCHTICPEQHHRPQAELPLTLQVLKGKSHINTQKEIRPQKACLAQSYPKKHKAENPRLACLAHPWLLLGTNSL